MKKQLLIPCRCAGRVETCGYLLVVNMGDDVYEFNWVKTKSQKKAKVGVIINKKDFSKIIKLLNI